MVVFCYMAETEVRLFTREDFGQLGEMYQVVTANDDVVFWWVGEEAEWPNVFLAIEGGRIVGKGQASVMTEIPPGSSAEREHVIFLNLKTLPHRAADYSLHERLYEPLLQRAHALKQALPGPYRTMIAVGNRSTETHNNAFFQSKGFVYWKSLYTMRREGSSSIEPAPLASPYRCSPWNSEDGVDEYLAADREIWPEAPIGREAFAARQKKASWTAFVVREHGLLVGSIMAWVDEDGDGAIEDVFVREPWRKQGIAAYLLARALAYLQACGCATATLQVETANQSALSLYRAAGFQVESEEARYRREL